MLFLFEVFFRNFMLPYAFCVLVFYIWYSLYFFVAPKILPTGRNLLLLKKITLLKIALGVFIILSIVTFIILYFFDESIIFNYSFKDYLIKKADSILVNLIFAVVLSLIGCLYGALEWNDVKKISDIKKLNIKTFGKEGLLFFLFMLPFVFVFLPIMFSINPLALIIMIGLPGALILFLK